MLFGSKKVIGLDIGTNTIKLAELEVSKTGTELISFGLAPTPLASIGAGEITNAQALGVAIAGLIAEVKSKRKQVCLGIWGTAVIVKKITIPRIDKKLIEDQIRWEAEQYIPFDVNDIALAHHVIDPDGSSETMDILLIASPNEMIRQYNSVVIEAKMQVGLLDVSGFALANTFEINYGKIPQQTIALLNIGAGNTNFVVIHSGEVVFSRDIPIGGANYTQEIQKEMGLSATEAESLKLSYSARKEVPEQVHTIINSSNEALTDEIRNGFDFFSASTTGLTITRCFFSGGGSAMPGLTDKVYQMANIPMELLNPFQRIRPGRNISATYMKQISMFAPIAIGLGLRKVGDS